MTTPPTCPYCGQPSKLVNGTHIYSHRKDLRDLFFWRCDPCGAHVGCHKYGSLITVNGVRMISDGKIPLGRLADLELRRAKNEAHAAFDSLWRSRAMSRGAAYRWLASALGVAQDECHIGMFDVNQCKAVVRAVERLQRNQEFV